MEQLQIIVRLRRDTGMEDLSTVAAKTLTYPVRGGGAEFTARVQQEAGDAIGNVLMQGNIETMRKHLKAEIDSMSETDLREACKRLDRTGAFED